jgi:uncharacterized membrane protein
MFQDAQQTPPPQQPEQPTVQNPQPQPSAAPAPTPPPAPAAQPQIPPVKTTQEERIWSAIGYIAFLGLLTLAMMPKSEFCKRHAAHGLTIFCAWFISMFVVLIVFWPFPAVIVSMIEGFLFLGSAALIILGILKSVQSYDMNIPVLTPIALKFPVNAIIGTIIGKVPEKTDTPQEPQNPQNPQTPQNP